MLFGGFTCSKSALIALNVVYIVVSFFLIGVAAYARLAAVVTSIGIVGGIIACGVFLFLVALLGLVGAGKHNQVLLFFYMVILFCLFLLQFSIACACLALNEGHQKALIGAAWKSTKAETHVDVMRSLECCGFESSDSSCGSANLKCCASSPAALCCTRTVPSANFTSMGSDTCPCPTCWTKIQPRLAVWMRVTGAAGLFFSFTEIIGVWLALRYRNQRDPKVDPNSFL